MDDTQGYSPSPDVMRAIAQIESGGDPNAVTGSYKGLYQLSQPEFQRYGGQGSIFDPAENTRVAGLKIADEANQLSRALGRPVTDAEVYLAHQQGVGGATAHLLNPDQPAWQSMLSTGEGRQKGAGWAKQAIWGNIPDAQKAQFGSVDNVTSGQFANLWAQRFGRAIGQPASIQTAQARPASPSTGFLPQGVTPQFPQQQTADNSAPQAPAPSPFQAPPIQQIQYYQRRPVSLANLRASLSAPSFRG